MGNIPFNSAGGPITPGGQSGNSEQEEAQRKIVKQYLDAMHKLEQAKFNLQFPEPVKPKSPGKQEGGTAIIGSIIEMLLKGKGDQTPLQFGPQYLGAWQQNAQEEAARQTMMGQQNYQRQVGMADLQAKQQGDLMNYAQGEAQRLGGQAKDAEQKQFEWKKIMAQTVGRAISGSSTSKDLEGDLVMLQGLFPEFTIPDVALKQARAAAAKVDTDLVLKAGRTAAEKEANDIENKWTAFLGRQPQYVAGEPLPALEMDVWKDLYARSQAIKKAFPDIPIATISKPSTTSKVPETRLSWKEKADDLRRQAKEDIDSGGMSPAQRKAINRQLAEAEVPKAVSGKTPGQMRAEYDKLRRDAKIALRQAEAELRVARTKPPAKPQAGALGVVSASAQKAYQKSLDTYNKSVTTAERKVASMKARLDAIDESGTQPKSGPAPNKNVRYEFNPKTGKLEPVGG